MGEIISVIGIFLATLMGTFGMNFWKLLEEWQMGPTRTTLRKTYGLCFICVVLLNLGIYLWRLFNVQGGGSLYPTYISRSPQEWLAGGLISSLVLWLFLCFLVRDKYLFDLGQLRQGLLNAIVRWKWFYIIDLTIMLGSYAYQVYFYGWNPWR